MNQPPQFTRTAPVYPRRRIQIKIDTENTLSAQLEMITGDGWCTAAWTDTLATGTITHKKSGLRVHVLPAGPPQPHAFPLDIDPHLFRQQRAWLLRQRDEEAHGLTALCDHIADRMADLGETAQLLTATAPSA